MSYFNYKFYINLGMINSATVLASESALDSGCLSYDPAPSVQIQESHANLVKSGSNFQSKKRHQNKPDYNCERLKQRLKNDMIEIDEACNEIKEKVRKLQTQKAMEKIEEKKLGTGEVKTLNKFIYRQHDKLRLNKRSDDPLIAENAFEMTIAKEEY